MTIGIDEVGRGVWAGPMLFVAVGLKDSINGLKDSKKLTKKAREKLAQQIIESAEYVGYGWVSPSEIDDLGLTKASTLACERALNKAPKNAKIFIDGRQNFLCKDTPCKGECGITCVIGGDDKVPEISAASIVAKVARDKKMEKLAKEYPNYGFDSNVGYGTANHSEAIKKYGLTPLHRWSYKPIQEFLNDYEA